jgi:hypothetical protein
VGCGDVAAHLDVWQTGRFRTGSVCGLGRR